MKVLLQDVIDAIEQTTADCEFYDLGKNTPTKTFYLSRG